MKDGLDCAQCRFQNEADAAFCTRCGARLESPCPNCQAPNAPDARFCKRCGQALGGPPASSQGASAGFASPQAYTPRHLAEKILTSKSALEGERKQVTVLFADVSGFTSLSERLDPEDVHGLMTQAFELMLAEVHRYEGTVNQFLGDGIMALFGAPIAHEDHAQRAVHAALGIRKALEGHREEIQRIRGISFRVRQGLNTGLVVVGSIGSDLRMDYTAVGDTTNVAARLQQTTEPGRIVISEATYRLAAGYFYTRPLGELSLKGKAEPVKAWEVISAREARTRLEVEAERGLSPFVGRERELQLLLECFEKVKAGHGQVVFLVGEPGIGKSRLLYELRRRLGEEATWVEGRCMSLGRDMGFHPLIDLLKRNFRIEESDPEATIAKKVDRGVLLLGEDLRPTLPYLRYLLSVDPGDRAVAAMDPRARRGEIFDAVRKLTIRGSQVRPHVVVLEDVHWMDKATEEYLRFFADSVPTSRLLLILTYRTGYAHPLGERTYHTRIALDVLPTDASVEMVRGALGTQSLPEDLRALILRKAEGHPFFIEEVVKSLREVGAIRQQGDGYVLAKRLEEVVVPDTIQDVIMARIDRLEEAPKRTLQLASVIGREFTRRLLDRIAEIRERTEECVQVLKAIELILEKSLFPELAYMFKHALTHEVAYGSLLVHRRKDLHRLIGLAVEELYADRLAEHYEILAQHFSKAEEWPKALEYLLKGAAKAAKAFAIRESLALYDQALEVAARLGDHVPVTTVMAIRQAKSSHYFAVGEYERSRAEGESLIALARQAGDRQREAAALAWTSLATMWAHDFDAALAYADQAMEVAQTALAGAYLTKGMIHGVTARHDEAREELGHALSISRSTGDHARESLTLFFLGFLRNWRGDYDEAAALMGRGVQVAREHKLLIPLLQNLWAQGVALTGKGNYDGALALLEEGLPLALKLDHISFIPRYLNTLGWLHGECEDLERALDLSARAAEMARTWHHAVGVEQTAYSEINRGNGLMARGDLAAARELFDEIHAIARDPRSHPWMRWRYTIQVCGSFGEWWLARGDPDKAGQFADESLELATRTDSRKYVVRGLRLKGEIAVVRRQWDEAERALGEALSVAQAIGNPRQLWKTHAALGRLHAERKQGELARQSYRAARDVIDSVKATLRDPRLRAGLDQSPLIHQIYDLSGS